MGDHEDRIIKLKFALALGNGLPDDASPRDVIALIDDASWARYYGEPDYEQPPVGVILANWNDVDDVIQKWLEDHGFTLEWSDEWLIDDDGQKCYRCVPSSWDWKPSYKIVDGCIVGIENDEDSSTVIEIDDSE